jgi:hypothetical protein
MNRFALFMVVRTCSAFFSVFHPLHCHFYCLLGAAELLSYEHCEEARQIHCCQVDEHLLEQERDTHTWDLTPPSLLAHLLYRVSIE